MLKLAGINFSTKKRRMQQSALLKLSREGLALNQVFRLKTTSFYFKTLGVKTGIEKLLDFDFLKLIERDARLMNFVNA